MTLAATPPSRHARAGSSLLEMLALITALAILMGIASAILYAMLRVDRGERARSFAAANLERLARDLRADCRDAAGPIERSDARLLIPIGDGRAVEYLVRESDVLRIVRERGKARGSDTYRRPAGTRARFEESAEGASPVVALVLSADPSVGPDRPADHAYRGYRVEAAAGRHARIARGDSP